MSAVCEYPWRLLSEYVEPYGPVVQVTLAVTAEGDLSTLSSDCAHEGGPLESDLARVKLLHTELITSC